MIESYCPKVKICGLRTHDDARLALELGASALGFNFYGRSPRFIEYQQARNIISQLDVFALDGVPTILVAVLVNPSIEELRKLLDIGVNAIQFHGNESPELAEFARTIGPKDLQVIKAVRLRAGDRALIAEWSKFADRLLIDAFDPNIWGGSGLEVDEGLLETYHDVMRGAFLAGGLTPENVSEKVLRFRPYGVDVASGVEIVPGIKDQTKMRQFIANVTRACRSDLYQP